MNNNNNSSLFPNKPVFPNQSGFTNQSGFSNQLGFANQVTSLLQKQQMNKRGYNQGTQGNFGMFMGRQKQEIKNQIQMIRNTQLFTDEAGPWLKAPEIIKQLFSNDQVSNKRLYFPQDLQEIKTKLKSYLENCPKNEITNYCCTTIQNKYYKCYNCFQAEHKDQNYKKIAFVICQKCFEPAQHVGHYYTMMQTNKYTQENLYCMCGKDMFPNQAVHTCKYHLGGQYTEQPHHEQNGGVVYDYFQSLFSIAFYLQKELYSFRDVTKPQAFKYNNFIIEIIKLMDECVPQYYDTICKYLFKKYSKDQNSHSFPFSSGRNNQQMKDNPIIYYLLHCFKSEPNATGLVLKLMCSYKFGFLYDQFISYFTKGQNRVYIHSNKRVTDQLNLQMRYLKNRIQKGGCCLSNQKNSIIWLKSPENYTYALQFIRKVIEKTEPHYYYGYRVFYLNKMQELIEAFSQIKVGNFWKVVGPELLPHLLSCYQLVYKDYLIQDDENDRQIEDERKSRARYWQEIKSTVEKIINRIIISLCSGKIQQIIHLDQRLEQIQQNYNEKYGQIWGQDEEEELISNSANVSANFGDYISELLKKSYNIFGSQGFNSRRPDYKSTNSSQNVKKLYQNQEYFMTQNLKKFMTLLLCFKQLDSTSILYKGSYSSNFSRKSDLNELNNQINEALKLLIFYKFLIPEFATQQFMNQKELIQYNNEKEQIVRDLFVCDKNFTPIQLKILKKRYGIRNFNQLVTDNLTYNIQDKIFNNPQRNQTKSDNCVELLAKSHQNFFIGFALQDFDERLTNQTQRQILIKLLLKKQILTKIKSNFGLTIPYINLILLLNRLCEDNNKQIKEQLENIKNNYLSMKLSVEQLNKAKLLFGQVQELDKQAIKKQANINFTQNSIEPISKMQEKATVQVQNSLCAVCKQEQTQENQFIYLIKTNVNSTVSSSFFPQVNLMKTNFRMCFHPLHINCYNQNTTCPTCKKFVNCMIPIKYEAKNKKLNRLSTNSMIVALHNNYKVYDIENFFILLFKHLVQSKVFLAQINVHLYEENKKKREKTDKFILGYLKDFYHKSHNMIQQEIQESVVNLKKQAEKIENKILAKIQQLFIYLIYEVIKNNHAQVQLNKILELYSKMRTEQFMVVKLQMKDLNVNLEDIGIQEEGDQSTKQKISKEYPVRLPNDAFDLKMFDKNGCSACQTQQLQSLCLICGVGYCQNCSWGSHHQNQHTQKTIQFIFSEAKVKFNMTLSSENRSYVQSKELCLYYDELKIPYKQVLNDAPIDAGTKIKLNQVLYYGITEMVLN